MLAITMAMVCAFCISLIMMKLAMTISKKKNLNREMSSPFECGFTPKSSARVPFSLQFFLTAIMFLIFDIEITLILPFILNTNLLNMMDMFYTFSIFILILLLGLYHEWNQSALDWKK